MNHEPKKMIAGVVAAHGTRGAGPLEAYPERQMFLGVCRQNQRHKEVFQSLVFPSGPLNLQADAIVS